MIIKKNKPITPSQRNYIRIYNNLLAKSPILKNKILGAKNNAGKNNSGKITVRHKGGGHKKKYRLIENFYNKNYTGLVFNIEYDPFRNTPIAAIFDFKTKNFYYMLAYKNIKVGDIIKSGINAELKTGHTSSLSKLPIGSLIYNISKTKEKSIFSKSAGTFSQIIEKNSRYCTLKLSSKKLITLPVNYFATLGVVDNEFFFLTTLGKAGRSRWINKRPTVRGVAMNPVDHPHGGGEGKKSGRKKTPWGKPNKKHFIVKNVNNNY